MQRRISLVVFSCFLSLALQAQFVLSGKVTGPDGNPLSGAVVHLDGSMAGTATNAQGAYRLKLKEGKHVVLVNHLGYKAYADTLEVSSDVTRDIQLTVNPLLSKEFVVEATRASEVTPMTFQNLNKEDIEQNNLGQDLPILLNQTVSAVTTSDAGAGVGYTGIRIRGSDATRINVTVNGVPLNDAESHGVFWVNMPDFASSTENIQIQRGVGTSSNGAAAFGATINLETSDLDSNAFVQLSNSYGSFNTRKHNAIVNTGLINGHYVAEARLSYIGSDGYIDRSASDLRSYYLAGGYYGKRMMVKAVTFAGKEVTQQAWWGTPESRLKGTEEEMRIHASYNGYTPEQTENLLTSGRTYNYYQYDNEIDHYNQDHYQLITGWQISPKLYLNLTGHYTYGRGYFEQFKGDDDYADFGLEVPVIGGDTFPTGDIIVRRWLNNHFYGGVYSLQYRSGGLNLTLGGAVNQYDGDHYGEVIWAEIAQNIDIRDRYYASNGTKLDASNYVKAEWTLDKLTLFGDVQGRFIDYNTQGVDNDQRPIDVDEQYLFLNPKAGASYRINGRQSAYLSVARSSREPVRSDFTDATPGSTPRPEFLTDAELGWNLQTEKFSLSANAYFMYYQDQLVLTGEVNDVGAPVRTNVPESYRSGIEAVANVSLPLGFYWQPNLTLSQNKIISFEEVLYDYTNGFDIQYISHENVDIAFSPNVIGGSQLGYRTDFGVEVALLTKYVGRQYLDNTENVNRSIDPYLVNDLRMRYVTSLKGVERMEWTLLVNNLFNEMYSANGYTYSYIYGDLITENFYYPQAGTNWLLGCTMKF